MRQSLLIASVVSLLFVGSAALADFALVSPGKLSRAHATVEGSDKCLKCHEQGKKTPAKLCLDCHKELQAQISAKKGFHGRMAESKLLECSSCHPEHAGIDFNLVDWGPGGRDGFDHQQTDYPLEGSHKKVKCDSCHQQQPGSKKAFTYIGLSSACKTCHFDEHRGQLSDRCQSCHDVDDWKAAPLFSHRKTDFPLLGKHKEVACAKCHATAKDERPAPKKGLQPLRTSFLKMNGFPFTSCESCHEDVHKGKFGKDCKGCHSEASWKTVSKLPQGREFHQKTRFPLQGAHADVACKLCHGPFAGTPAKYKGLKFAACSDCHVDAHIGQIPSNLTDPGKTCDNCHTTQSFLPAEFEIADHSRTAYPLEGAHRAVRCDACHAKDKSLLKAIPKAVTAFLARQGRQKTSKFSLARLSYKTPPTKCESCHQDPHKGQFTRTAPIKSCADCHTVQSFHTLKFNHDRDSRYPLTGQHAKVACQQCHTTVYRGLRTTCTECHTDVHVGQLREPRSRLTNCETCHTTGSFKKPDLRFDHNNPRFTTYALLGLHAKLPCTSCHPSVKFKEGFSIVRYKPLPRDCQGCHEAIHQGRFKDFEP